MSGEPVENVRPNDLEVAPDCPRCARPLALEPVRDTGRWRWRCSNRRCRYTTTRDRVVEELLRELYRTRDLFEQYARMSLPGLVRELVASDLRCSTCEAKWREAVVAALDRADARAQNGE